MAEPLQSGLLYRVSDLCIPMDIPSHLLVCDMILITNLKDCLQTAMVECITASDVCNLEEPGLNHIAGWDVVMHS